NERRCLIVERHTWETGGGMQQLQFVLDLARLLSLGPGHKTDGLPCAPSCQRTHPPRPSSSRSRSPESTQTARAGLTAFHRMGAIPASFIFFEETDEPAVYDLWW